MMARNHVPFAMACWWWWQIAICAPIEVQGTMAAAVGSLLPDLDHPESALGRRLPLISVPLSRLVGHRGVTHSLLAVVGLFGVLLAVVAIPAYQGLGGLIMPLVMGYLSHILGDAMTPSGVPLFWPKRRTYSLNLFKTWGWQETTFVGAFTIGTVIWGGVIERLVDDLWSQLAVRAWSPLF
jgi:inner membrane protein